ncbi:hypothetical protein J6590_054788 [Homalodisca vitripennis]|nr:hypothetical protein J6590_054788 [Homalodisca vitripennis]
MEHWRAGEVLRVFQLSLLHTCYTVGQPVSSSHDGTLASWRGTESVPVLIATLQTVTDILHSWTACQQFTRWNTGEQASSHCYPLDRDRHITQLDSLSAVHTMEHWRAGEVLRVFQLSLLHTCYTVGQPVSSSHDGTLASWRGTENVPLDSLSAVHTMEHWRAGEVLRVFQLSLLHTCYTVGQPVSSSHDGTLASWRGTESVPALIAAHMLHNWIACQRRGTENVPALIAAIQTVSHVTQLDSLSAVHTMEHWRAGSERDCNKPILSTDLLLCLRAKRPIQEFTTLPRANRLTRVLNRAYNLSTQDLDPTDLLDSGVMFVLRDPKKVGVEEAQNEPLLHSDIRDTRNSKLPNKLGFPKMPQEFDLSKKWIPVVENVRRREPFWGGLNTTDDRFRANPSPTRNVYQRLNYRIPP